MCCFSPVVSCVADTLVGLLFCSLVVTSADSAMAEYKINSKAPILSGPVTRKNALEFIIPRTRQSQHSIFSVNTGQTMSDPCQQTFIPPESDLDKWESFLMKNPDRCIECHGGPYDLGAVRVAKFLH